MKGYADGLMLFLVYVVAFAICLLSGRLFRVAYDIHRDFWLQFWGNLDRNGITAD